jgi:hypothetical protein
MVGRTISFANRAGLSSVAKRHHSDALWKEHHRSRWSHAELGLHLRVVLADHSEERVSLRRSWAVNYSP